MSCGKQFNVVKYKKGSKERNAGILGEAENCLPGHLCPECSEFEDERDFIMLQEEAVKRITGLQSVEETQK